MDGGPSNTGNFDDYHGRLQTCALNATRKSAGFPLDIAFHRSMDSDLAEELDIFSERVLSVTNRVLSLISTVDQSHIGKSKRKAKVESQDDVVDNFYSLIVDATDLLLEKTDICLDDVLGKNKAPAIPIKPPVDEAALRKKSGGKKHAQPGRLDPVIQHASTLPKPQLLFNRKHDNSDSPWRPVLSHKYNAKVPLGYIYHDLGTEHTIVSHHPYQYEINHLSYPARMFTPCTPIPPTSLEDTYATWVDTPQEFQDMVSKLRSATEIAVDLEHHSYRSYAGFLCLMQISVRDQDWIIDLLAVRDEIETLNEVFTDPAIVKVFHGADSDIVWLQQDFNVYVVNLFDTFHASKLLEFPQHGLAHLLEMYCDFIPDKRYQLADWRIRPLPDEMLHYARSDTHFLLYIYDNLRNALLDRSKSKSLSGHSTPTPTFSGSSSSRGTSVSLLEDALARSAETALKVYTKEPYDVAEGSGSGGWDTLAKRWNKISLTAGGPDVGIGGMRREVYKRVHWWRERVAREEDESTRYVLQNHSLFLIAEQPPADMAGLLSLFRPTVPPIVKKRAKELLLVITDAIKGSLSSSQVEGTLETRQIAESKTEKEVNGSEKRDEVVMLDTEMQSLEYEREKADLKSIWRLNLEKSTSSSSLFGESISSKLSVTAAPAGFGSFTTSLSSLFGGKSDTVVRRMGLSRTSGHSNFAEVVFRINQSLTMAPAIPQIVESPIGNQVENPPLKEIDEVSNAQDEIPYVPASQRSARQEEKDTIVVVGQVRQKRKRKAERTFASDLDVTSSAKQFEDKDSNTKRRIAKVEEPFDFSSVPNILDDDPEAGKEEGEETEKRRKRQKKTNKKGGTTYGDFPAPPKAHSELKSGNKSYTFK